MPCVDDWLNNPLGIVQNLFVQNSVNLEWEKKVIEFFQDKLHNGGATNWVPSLNNVPLHYLKPNSLVKFRCMVQDMFDPEFYMGVYETVDPVTKQSVLHFGKYRDVAECEPHHEVDFSSSQTVTLERQTFYCIPVPGEASWVKEAYANASQARVNPSTSYTPNRHKRSYEEDEDVDLHPSKQKDQHSAGPLRTLTPERQPNGSSTCSTTLDLNFPLPGEKGPACLVKVYEKWEDYKVNDILEVYGILSVEPKLSGMTERDSLSGLGDPMECMDTEEEQRVHSPPSSLVPRLHVIIAQKLQHVNPLIPVSFQNEDGKTYIESFNTELSYVRAELLGFLTQALLGDGLAAEYLILHLISTVYARRDILPLGKFTMNLSGCPRNSNYAEHTCRVIQHLVPSSYRLPMTLQNMNNMRFIPHKDYSANRLVSGVLQLANNTSLIVDETVLEQGQLESNGVRNLTALSNLITWQKVDYDFNYHQMEFCCNVNVLVLSEGKSLLPSDCQVHLQPQIVPPNIEEYMNSLLSVALPSVLNKFRIYLSLLRLRDYSISEDVTKAVEEDFVDMRKTDPQSITAEDLHRMLVLARLLSLSVGQTTLTRERWIRAKQLDCMRKSRLDQQRLVNGNEP